MTSLGIAWPAVAASVPARRPALRGANAARGAALPCMCVRARGSLMQAGHAISKRKAVESALIHLGPWLVLACWASRGVLARGDSCKRRVLRRVVRAARRGVFAFASAVRAVESLSREVCMLT